MRKFMKLFLLLGIISAILVLWMIWFDGNTELKFRLFMTLGVLWIIALIGDTITNCKI
jgi:heme A synthase